MQSLVEPVGLAELEADVGPPRIGELRRRRRSAEGMEYPAFMRR